MQTDSVASTISSAISAVKFHAIMAVQWRYGLRIYFTYNSINTTIKYYRFLFIATCFDSTESSSGYDLEQICKPFWDHKMQVNTL